MAACPPGPYPTVTLGIIFHLSCQACGPVAGPRHHSDLCTVPRTTNRPR